ncbi:hypothetical protein B0H13DRAFT_1887686 [Mycena leptocephala]|nr:hypothetical protein B0H13DRAFT_1887686 [Mycena leptocephala]
MACLKCHEAVLRVASPQISPDIFQFTPGWAQINAIPDWIMGELEDVEFGPTDCSFMCSPIAISITRELPPYFVSLAPGPTVMQMTARSLERDHTESEALADAEDLERLRKQTVGHYHTIHPVLPLTLGQPSPVPTELCYDSWPEGEIMMHFKNSGESKIRDFAYPPNDPLHGGVWVPAQTAQPVNAPTPLVTPQRSHVNVPPTLPEPPESSSWVIRPLPRRALTRVIPTPDLLYRQALE